LGSATGDALTRLGLEWIISGYPQILSILFLARLKTLYYHRVFFGKAFVGIEEYWVNTKFLLIPISIGKENTGEVNKALGVVSTL
jgi:hypothetical protein